MKEKPVNQGSDNNNNTESRPALSSTAPCEHPRSDPQHETPNVTEYHGGLYEAGPGGAEPVVAEHGEGDTTAEEVGSSEDEDGVGYCQDT